MFGPYEPQISSAYRRLFVNLDSMIAQTVKWQPAASRILEVEWGEGALAILVRA